VNGRDGICIEYMQHPCRRDHKMRGRRWQENRSSYREEDFVAGTLFKVTIYLEIVGIVESSTEMLMVNTNHKPGIEEKKSNNADGKSLVFHDTISLFYISNTVPACETKTFL